MVKTSQTNPQIKDNKNIEINSKEPMKNMAEVMSPVSCVISKTV